MFNVGDEVVCIDESVGNGPFWRRKSSPLGKGRVYTVEGIISAEMQIAENVSLHPHVVFENTGEPCALLKEVRNPAGGGWRISRFRKVQRRDLTAWLATATTHEGPVRRRVGV